MCSLDQTLFCLAGIYTHKLGWLRVPARRRRQAGSHKQVSGRGALPQRSQQTPAGCPKGRAAHNQRSHGQTSEQAEESWAHRQRSNGCMHAEAWHAWVGWVRLGGVCKGATSGGRHRSGPAAAARQQRTAAAAVLRSCTARPPARRRAALQAGFKRRPQARLLRSPARLQGGGAQPGTICEVSARGTDCCSAAAQPQVRLAKTARQGTHKLRHTENGRASTAPSSFGEIKGGCCCQY